MTANENDAPSTADPALTIRTKPDAPAVTAPKPPTRIGLMPETVDQAWRLAQIMAKAGDMVPKSYHDKPEAVMLAIMFGAELGMTPAQAITAIAVVGGRVILYGDGLMAVVKASPHYVEHDEWFEVDGGRRDTLTADDIKQPTTGAVCRMRRRGADDVVRRFTVADAMRAKLIGKPGPWTEYPQIMLKSRARMFAARDQFPDVLRGVASEDDAPPSDAAAATTPAPVVRRLSDPPPPERTRLEPARVDTVTQYDNGDAALVILSTGVRVIVPDLRDAHALAQLVDTDARVVVTVTRGPDDALTLASFVDAAVFDVDRPE